MNGSKLVRGQYQHLPLGSANLPLFLVQPAMLSEKKYEHHHHKRSTLLNMWQCIESGPAWVRPKHVVEKIEKTLKNIHYIGNLLVFYTENKSISKTEPQVLIELVLEHISF